MANVLFKFGTRAQYDALITKDVNALYWLMDTQELYRGETLFGKGIAATQAAAGLLSAEDKQRLDALVASGIMGLHAVDASMLVDSDENGKTVGVQLSAVDGNILELKNDGLFVPSPDEITVPEYVIERQAEAESDAAATYKLKRTAGGIATYVGDPINIPADLMLQSGSLEIVTVDDEPYEGARVGDPYIDLVLNDPASTHIYIPVKGLVDVYTAGDGIAIVNNMIELKAVEANGLSVGPNGLELALATPGAAGALSAVDKAFIDALPSELAKKVDRQIMGMNGKALVFNESDGGGAKFEHVDGTLSFVGVNDGGENGVTGQLYTVKKDAVTNKYIGARLNMTANGFYYTNGRDSMAYTAEDEIATKKDIEDAALEWQEMA